MSYNFNPLNITHISVIGSGQIGPDIALHFAKALAQHNVAVNIIDISPDALENAQLKINKKIYKGLELGNYSPEQAESIKNALNYSTDFDIIRPSQLVIEAATEDEDIKDLIFRKVEALTDNNCIFLSNSSHMQPEVIFQNINNKSRALVAHYFYPADVNQIVELVPSYHTDADLLNLLMQFYRSIGKIPIKVNSSYGYAVDPIFEGLCQTAVLALENGLGNEKEIDLAAKNALGLGVGPFTALNLTGGNPITAHGLDEMGKYLMAWFNTPELLHSKVESKELWNTAKRTETVEISPEKEEKLTKLFQGAYFALASFILNRGIVNINDLNMACQKSLSIKSPFSLMNELGIDKSYDLVKDFCASNPSFQFPPILEQAKNAGGWSVI